MFIDYNTKFNSQLIEIKKNFINRMQNNSTELKNIHARLNNYREILANAKISNASLKITKKVLSFYLR